MPLIKVETNVVVDDIPGVTKELSALAATMLGKPEAYVLAILDSGKYLLFGGEEGPAAFVSLDSIGFPADRTTEFSETICDFLSDKIGVPANRIYIAFGDVERTMFGWNKGTF